VSAAPSVSAHSADLAAAAAAAVYWIMGARHSTILSIAQHANMILTTIGYQIAAADSMR
jgi:hypothetical protein